MGDLIINYNSEREDYQSLLDLDSDKPKTWKFILAGAILVIIAVGLYSYNYTTKNADASERPVSTRRANNRNSFNISEDFQQRRQRRIQQLEAQLQREKAALESGEQ